jgi:hypothetical protein
MTLAEELACNDGFYVSSVETSVPYISDSLILLDG